MDAVQAVSALSMALAVAWADWVMSCCGVGSVAMSQMVRKTWWHKNISISETVCWIGLKFTQHLPEGIS